MSLDEWVSQAGLSREDCFKHGYRELYLDIGFFNAQFASVEFVLTYLLLLASNARDPRSIERLMNSMDASAKAGRFRLACAVHGAIGPNLDARLRVFEDQSIALHRKIVHSTILPGDDWPDSYEFVSTINQLNGVTIVEGRSVPSETVRSDRIWKHGMWLSGFVSDLSSVALAWTVGRAFEIPSPGTPVLVAS